MNSKSSSDTPSPNSQQLLQTRWSLIGRLKDWDDKTSWQEFFEAYRGLIYGVALKVGLSDAEAQEVVQETVIAIAKKMPDFKCGPAAGSFKGFLLQITSRRIADQFRKRAKVMQASGLSAASAMPVPPSRGSDDGSRAATVDRVADP